MVWTKSKNRSGVITGWLIIVLILIQFIPLDRAGHPSKTPSDIPGDVLAILQSRCFDCHSGETRWPQTAYMAPLSWYVTGKVRQARKALDFSRFDALPDAARRNIEQSVSSLASETSLSKHGTIPGFPGIGITEKEQQVLAGWDSDNNREQKKEYTIHRIEKRMRYRKSSLR